MGQFADLFDEEKPTQQRAAMNLRFGIEAQPDVAARDQALARRFGLPPAVIEQYRPDYAARAAVADAAPVLEQSPKLRGWLADDAQRAKVAHDDVPQMGAIEAAVKWLVSAPDAPRGGLVADVFKAGRAIASGAPSASAGLYGAAAAPFEVLGLDTIGQALRGQQKNAQAVADSVRGMSPDAGFTEQSLMSGFQSAGQNLIMLPFGLAAKTPNLMLGIMGAVTGGQSYGKGRDAGLDPAQAAAFGIQDATAEIVTERFLGAAGFLKNIKAGASAGKLFGYEVFKEVPGEIGATLWQNFNEWANVNPDKSIHDFLSEQPAAIAQTIIATLVGGSVQIGAIKGIEAAVGRAQAIDQQAQLAEQHGQALADVSKLIEASKLRQRDPEAFATFAQSLTEEGVSSLYVDARALQQSGVDLQALAQAMPSVAQQIEQAVATGGDVVIPTGEFLTQAPGQEWSAALIDHARTAADAMSPAGAREYMQAHGEQLQEEIARTIEQHATDTEWQAGRDAVRADFHRQLDEVGRWQPEVNRQYAALLGDYYAATAARAGMTPQELAERYPLRIQAKAPGGAVNAMEQGDGLPYQIDHKPMTKDGGASTLDDLTGAFGEDIYGKDALQFFGSGDAREKGVLRTLKALRGKPDAMVTIYRGVPAEAAGINPGDWVTISKEAAQDYADQHPDGKIVSMQVPASHVTGWADSLLEFGYHPPRAALNQSAQLPASIDIDGQQRSTTNSNGQQIAATEDGVRNFWRWFGDSKVVDAEGRPLVVYHGGTFNENENPVFDPAKDTFNEGFFFTPYEDRALRYSNGDPSKVTRAYLRIENPDPWIGDKTRLAAEGRDGVRDGTTGAWAAFSSEQIKSVNNIGTFDPANPSILNQLAYHGTPYLGIDKFSVDKIGAGEGAQAYGWGLYFAGERAVAEWYRKKLARSVVAFDYTTPDGVPPGVVSKVDDAVRNADRATTVAEIIEDVQAVLDSNPPYLRKLGLDEQAERAEVSAAWFREHHDSLNMKKITGDKGQLYEVDIPEDSDMLLWDKPLSDQPAKVREALTPILQGEVDRRNAEREALNAASPGRMTHPVLGKIASKVATVEDLRGQVAYDQLSKQLGGDKEASDALAAAGIKGIKYLDGTSRGAGDGSFNYVIFSGDDVAIRQTFYQGAQQPRAQIAFGQDITQQPSVISLFDGADLSSLIHEAGHFFLEAHMDLAGRIAGRIADGEQVSDGERGIVADANALLGWFGVQGDEAAGGAGGGALEQPAYHGTPYRGIERFSTDKIGTGEGAQAYGWGLYFASKKDIAEHYRKTLSGDGFGVVKIDGNEQVNDPEFGDMLVLEVDERPAKTLTGADGYAFMRALVEKFRGEQAQLALEWLDKSEARGAEIEVPGRDQTGQLYEVDIPEDDTMLLWDKPLSEQPAKAIKSLKSVREALTEAGVLDDYLERKNADWEELTGQDVYEIVKRASLDDALPSNGPGVEEAQAAGQDDKAASLWLWNEGLAGIKYLDGTSRNAGDGSYNYVIFSGDDTQITGTFYQGGQTDARPEPPALGRTPLETWAMMSIDQKRPYHEQFARGFELYALEGKAPSLSLQPVFQRFSAWLKDVYRSITQRAAEDVLQVSLTDEVRQVMDRMIATDEQIAEAQAMREMGPLFGGADQAGMSSEQWAQYHELAAQATAHASEQLQARGLRDMQWLRNARSRELKRLQARAAGLRREVEMEVRRDVLSMPIYRAWQFLTTKGDAQATAQPTPRVRASGALDPASDNLFTAIAKLGGLDRSEVVGAWGVDPKDRLESGVFGAPVLRKENGLSIDAMAEKLAEEGYLLRDENGRTDPADLEAAFDSQRRGVDQYSTWHDMAEDARVRAATQQDAPEALPDEIMHGKLDTAVLRDMYSTKPDALWRTLSDRRMTSEAQGIHPEVVAETFGYDSADALVRALAAADPPRQVIEGLTDQRMLERYGDLATPEGLQREADKAIHNEARARAIATELDALEKMGKVRAGGPRTADVLAKAARDYAAAVIGAKKVRDIRPGEYTAAEARASKAAQKAFKAGDTMAAATEKRHQLIQHAAAKAALQAREEIDKTLDYLRRMAKRPKSIAPDYADQIDQLLERFDLRPASLKELDKRAGLQAWVTAQQEQGKEVDIPPELLNEAARTSWRNLTLDELRGLRDTVKQIEHLGRTKGKLLASKAKREFEAVRDELADGIELHSRGRTADTRTPATVLGRRLAAIKRFGTAHIKVATWARIFDGGRDGGPAWEYLIRGANDAGDFETTRRAQATEALTKILAPVMKSSKLHRKAQYASVNRSLTREQVLVMALNAGNEGNWQRMMDGEGWTRPQVMGVLNTLTAAEWQAVQGVWDHMESYRPEIGAKEKRVYGKEPEWVQSVPLLVDTSDGQRLSLRGGYFPIKYDPAANARAEGHADAEDAKRQMQGAYTSATTRRGFTKSRVQEVKGRPLMYSLSAVYGGVQDVIHDLAWHEWLIDTNKLLRSEKVDAAIRQHYGPEVVKQVKDWVKDIAAGDGPAQGAVDEAVSRLRRGVSVAGLGFNVMSAAMQPLGLTQSMVRVGAAWIGRGVAQYIASPRAAARRVNAASEFMASRARTRFRELNELRNQVEGQAGALTWVQQHSFWLMMRAQQTVDIPTWLGAYEKAISEGSDEARSVALADQAVIDSQGGGQLKDLAGIERGGPAQKLFTVFYSFFNTALNIGIGQGMTADTPAKRAKLAADALLLYSVPAVLGAILKDALQPGGDDDPEELAKKLAAAQLDYLMGLFVLVRETTEAVKIVTGLEDRPRDYAGPAGLRVIPDAFKFAKQAGQGEFDDAFRKAAVNLIGSAFGLPAAQVNRTITGAQALAEDDTDNPAALVFGFQKER